MSDLSYCRFRNTLPDLRDCYKEIGEELSKEESSARAQLIGLCRMIAEDYPDIDSVNNLPVEEEEEEE